MIQDSESLDEDVAPENWQQDFEQRIPRRYFMPTKNIKKSRWRLIYQVLMTGWMLKIFQIGKKNVNFFYYANTLDKKKAKLTSFELRSGALAWWDQLQNNRRFYGK